MADASASIVAETAMRIFADLADPQTVNRAKDEAWRAPLWRAIEEAVRTPRVPRVVEPEPRPEGLHPRIESKPIDYELIFPGKPLPTLMDYARLLKELGQGEPLKTLAAAGIDISTWPGVATAWGQALMGRMELALRFGELMSAPWE